MTDSLVTRENPHGYWCRQCGRSREHAERWCSSANCTDRRAEENRHAERIREGCWYAPFVRLHPGPGK